MLIDTTPDIPRSLDDLLGKGLAARLDRLDLASRKLFAGKMPGERRSKRRGRSVEFDDYRGYIPGDDLRHLDWNILARLDRYVVKLFREEEDLELRLIIDASPSMLGVDPPGWADEGTGSPERRRPVTKLVYALRIAAALAYIGLVNNNRVSAHAFGLPGPPARLGGLRGRRSLERCTAFFLDVAERGLTGRTADVNGGGGTSTRVDLRKSLRSAIDASSRGVVLVLSDLLYPSAGSGPASSGPGELERGLAVLRAAGGPGALDVSLIQVLTASEREPVIDPDGGFSGDLRLTDAESAAAAEVSVSAGLVRAYRRRLASHLDAIRTQCNRLGFSHTLTTTSDPVDTLVTEAMRRGGVLG